MQISSVYLLLGPEKGLREDFISKLKTSLGTCDVAKFYAFEDYEQEMFAQLAGNDLFADKKLIILDDAQEIRAKNKVDAIVQYIKNPSETVTFLICSTDLYIDSAIMNAVPNTDTIKFYELFESKKNEWLKNFFRRCNLKITNEACIAIIEKVDNNISEFENVCYQLALYISGIKKDTVTEDDVDEYLVHTKQETAFTLFGYIAKRNLESALECLQALCNTNDEAETASVLASRLSVFFRRAISIKILMNSGNSFDDAVAGKYYDTDRPIRMPKDKEVYRCAVSNYSLEQLQYALSQLASYDINLKETGTFLQSVLMDSLIIKLIPHKSGF